MDIEIITTAMNLNCYGFSGIAEDGDYAGTAFKLMDKMWQTVRLNKLPNQGKNIWIYGEKNSVFAGIELNAIPSADIIIENKNILLAKYAYYKHTGSYSLIKQVGNTMKNELAREGFEAVLPYAEIYGHWTNDESKLETELLMCLR